MGKCNKLPAAACFQQMGAAQTRKSKYWLWHYDGSDFAAICRTMTIFFKTEKVYACSWTQDNVRRQCAVLHFIEPLTLAELARMYPLPKLGTMGHPNEFTLQMLLPYTSVLTCYLYVAQKAPIKVDLPVLPAPE